MKNNVGYEVKKDEFVIKNYNNAKAFASFLPGIAGLWGKPMWVYYVNRGQCISSFGVKDKSGAMLEFQAANKAYRYTLTQGFRSFLKVNGNFYEPFQDNEIKNTDSEQNMYIYSSGFKITDMNKKIGILTTVEYFTLPNEDFPALLRKLTIKNISDKKQHIECIDGLPMINPYGTPEFLLKNLSRLAEGWYQGIIFSDKYEAPIYKLAVEPSDDPKIVPIKAGHFYYGILHSNGKTSIPKFIVDPDNLFENHHDFEIPINFINNDKFTINKKLLSKNKTPSAMGYFETEIDNSKEFVYYSVIGHSCDYKKTDKYIDVLSVENFFDKKQIENYEIVEKIKNDVAVKSSSQEFDNYTKQSYLDNILRGGYPITLNGSGKNKLNYYVYSRIHGDLEREYNNFVILPEYFSQGNGSYRDVNQNRRNDVFIHPNIGYELIIMLINLIQLDGFNPLRVLGTDFYIKNKKKFLSIFKSAKDKKLIESFISKSFSLGSFFNYLDKNNIKISFSKKDLLRELIENAERMDKARADDCYWSDHWHYNIDLIESYLSVFPENRNKILFLIKDFVFYDNSKIVLPRQDKYVLTEGKIPKQLHSVVIDEDKEKMISSRKINSNLVHTQKGKGTVYKTTLICKLLSLVANKYASLDPHGIGIEMDADKPNWCDALNGLPGIFGSSTAESLELKRLLIFILNSLKDFSIDSSMKIFVPKEIWMFINKLFEITKKSKNQYDFWNDTHTEKEKYWKQIKFGISGEEKSFDINELINIIESFYKNLSKGLEKAFDKKTGVIITNFEYIPEKFTIIKKAGKIKQNRDGNPCISVHKFKRRDFPLFLEGPVHYMRVSGKEKDVLSMHEKVLKSDLYDTKIKMFKNTGSLKDANNNLGRIAVFTPGWLENESVFSHMEYKYLLELLRNKMSGEFFKYAKTALIPYMNPYIYGRSIFENVSFIVSSAHPEQSLHGRGFVSRLTGTTAEFISIWIAITSGLTPFSLDDNKNLLLNFNPQIMSELFTKEDSVMEVYNDKLGAKEYFDIPKNSFAYKFMGRTIVVYNNPYRKNLFPSENYDIKKIKITYHNGNEKFIENNKTIGCPYSKDIRNGEVKRIDIDIC